MVIPNRAKFRIPVPVILIYCIVGLVILSAGIWLANDLMTSRSSIIAERSALAVQTSRFMSQWFGTTIMSTDYVLRDVTTKVTVAELDQASSDPEVQKRLSAFVREKLATLPSVNGFALLDHRAVFVAVADEKLLGTQSNSKLHVPPGQVLENRTYVEYVPAAKSANKQPAILVSRPILSSEGYVQGGALAAIMLSSAQDWIATFDIGEHDTMALVDGDGILLASNPPRPDGIGTLLHSPTGQPSFGDQRGSASFIAVSPLDGRERIYGVSKVENIPLSIIVGFDQAYILRDWQQRVWQSLAGFFTLLFMLGLVFSKHLEALAQRDEMQKLAITDPLTGVANRRQLILSGEIEIAKAVRYKHQASVLMVDIDHFKSINDTWGHPTGDRVIQSLANAMVANVRHTDVVGRLGGEEFAVVLTGTDSEGAFSFANRLREFIERSVTVTSDGGSQVFVTVSIGVASLEEGASSFDEILGRADKALYNAKGRGRNKVVLG
jgi:diguanylate cyclase (GGDEF)-like protein